MVVALLRDRTYEGGCRVLRRGIMQVRGFSAGLQRGIGRGSRHSNHHSTICHHDAKRCTKAWSFSNSTMARCGRSRDWRESFQHTGRIPHHRSHIRCYCRRSWRRRPSSDSGTRGAGLQSSVRNCSILVNYLARSDASHVTMIASNIWCLCAEM